MTRVNNGILQKFSCMTLPVKYDIYVEEVLNLDQAGFARNVVNQLSRRFLFGLKFHMRITTTNN